MLILYLLKFQDNNLFKCSCGSISVPDTSPSKAAETIEKPESALIGEKTGKADVAMATYLDVAVLRCLFISQWLEEGIFWALKYLCQRYNFSYNFLKFV